jgi:ribosomal protein S18 acetylase RimI-like enzyme
MTLIGLVLMAGVGSKCLKHALEDADRRGLAILLSTQQEIKTEL